VSANGLLVVTSIGDVVRRHYGVGQSSYARHNHGGIAQIAVADHTPLGHHSHRVHLDGTRLSRSPVEIANGVRSI